MDFAAAHARIMGDKNPIEAMRILFPDRHRRQAFKDWAAEEIRKATPEPLTRDKFIADIDNAQFLDPSFLNSMPYSMSGRLRPWVAVGRDEHFSYRLTVERYGLQPTADLNLASQLPPCILAFQSYGKPDFVFFQLGELEYTPYTTATTTAIRRWDETGFYVVARIGPSGKMDGIFAVYRMPSEDDNVDEAINAEDDWGLLPTPLGSLDSMAKRFFCARLGGSLGELGDDHRLDWEDNILYEDPVELVPVSSRQQKEPGMH
ncbi:hypothetical protein B0T25DRAFT_540350 [Lasiosphaeria hispida]|uniref:Uncharacterized protein n=1 Tax=Lasiosphaeria hispida TaxID=260671 RepID=A0AAJ0HNI5_9PEZI|nr:hypothetical protein B0T25DRAFT_540350 [Lasiosphaeria hispida]